MHGIGFKPDDVELTELRLHSKLKKQGDNIDSTDSAVPGHYQDNLLVPPATLRSSDSL
jgi:hypothetical protein